MFQNVLNVSSDDKIQGCTVWRHWLPKREGTHDSGEDRWLYSLGSYFSKLQIVKASGTSLTEEAEQDTCGYGRTDNTGYIRRHRMHEEVIVLVEFSSDIL